MKRILMTAVMMMFGASFLAAETTLHFDGQVRVRGELDGRGQIFRENAHWPNYGLLRTRVGLTASVEDNALAYVQFQDSRVLGDVSVFGQPTSGTLNDGKNVDVHQAFLQVSRLIGEHIGLRAGRFEVNLGNQRVFGSVGWHNVGRSWEGAEAWYDRDAFRLTGYWLKRLEVNSAEEDEDFDVFGGVLGLRQWGVEVFGFQERDRTIPAHASEPRLTRTNLGLYYRGVMNRLDATLNAVYQFGDGVFCIHSCSPLTQVHRDISAHLIAGEIGYLILPKIEGRAALGIDYTSGDDNPLTGDFTAYDNLYYTGHKFNGYMDLFLPTTKAGKRYEYAGLLDVVAELGLKPADGWTLFAHLHYFRSAAVVGTLSYWLSPSPEEFSTTWLGTELDIVARTTRIRGAVIEVGASMFVPAETTFAARTDPDPGFWGYLVTVVDF